MRIQKGTLQILFLTVLLAFVHCTPKHDETKTSLDIYKEFSKIKGAEVLALPPKLVAVFLDDEKVGNSEIIEILKDVKMLTLLVLPNNGKTKENIHLSNLSHDLNELNFVDLTMVNNGNEIIRVKVLRDSSNIEELVVLVSNYEALFCVSFIGNISMDKVLNLTKPENMIAVSNLNRLSSK
jgi:hypothetical protein